MDLGLNQKVVVYTGAAGFIGSAACLALAREGAHLALIDVHEGRLCELEKVIRSEFPNIKIRTYSQCNSLSVTDVEKMLDDVQMHLGEVDILVNSAYPRTADWHLRFEDIPFDSWRKNVDDHLNSYFLMTQRVSLRMIPRKSGNIVNFSSIYGLVGPNLSVYDGLDNMTMPAAYSAIKGGITNFTRYLASYLGSHSIRVNSICPGGVHDAQDPRFVAAYEKIVPLKRMASVEDVVRSLIYLTSDMSSYVTGQNLAVDGGWTAI
jgi:NAD(P)-dependent dehydrogenase (short-subunit alcohol dehydrogenase family)